MQAFGSAELIYCGQTKKSSGSPVEVTVTLTVPVKEVKTFSLRYYQTYGTLKRSMRHSKNFVVSTEMCEDRIIDGVTYELMYLVYLGKKYTIHEILNYYKSSVQMLLDCQETS